MALPDNTMNHTEITVIIPVYRGAATLGAALDSLIGQIAAGMEILVLDDGSPDHSGDIAIAYTRKMAAIEVRVYRHANRGLAATLNRGIELAHGRYIARQDQDDLVLPGRLEKQKRFLDEHPDVAMVGTWCQIYSGDVPTSRYHRHPYSSEALKLELLFDNPFVHSSMMIRTDALREVGGYCEDKSRQPPEDYELWSRISRRYRVANLPEVLTIYREVPGSMSRTGENPFLPNVIRISAENLGYVLTPVYSQEDCYALAELYHRGQVAGFHSLLNNTKARAMLKAAALKLGGDKQHWSEEFRAIYHRMRVHLDSRFLRKAVPECLRGPARWLRNRILRRQI